MALRRHFTIGVTVTALAVGSALTALPAQADPSNPDFGPNVTVFDSSMSVDAINAAMQAASHEGEYSLNRHAFFFKPGTYGSAAGENNPSTATGVINTEVGYYMTVAGLGGSPDDVLINGAIHVEGKKPSTGCPWEGQGDMALTNFWRSLSNISINPIQKPVPTDVGGYANCTSAGQEGVANPHQMRWAVSQAAPLRRVDIKGDLTLMPRYGGQSSGGYMASTKVSGTIVPGSQQQWYSRDSSVGTWNGGVWNMVFSGVQGAPTTNFADAGFGVFTTMAQTPVSRDAPFMYVDGTEYKVFVPNANVNTSGVNWSTDAANGRSLSIDTFYIAHEGDSAATINAQLAAGKNLLVTPGVYQLSEALKIDHADTVVLGLGMASFTPINGTSAIEVADVSGVEISGLTIDAGPVNSDVLIKVGPTGASVSNASDPTTLSDIFVRIGGNTVGKATTSIEVNSPDTLLDHLWLWRADHGTAVGWNSNTADHGLVVNADNVTATGLFVEHYQKAQVIWNGNGGRTVFFQCELPYDVPSQAAWMDGTRNGYAGYEVAADVTTHSATGMGIYSYFNQGVAVFVDSAVHAPLSRQVTFQSVTSVFLNGAGGITKIVNDTGLTAAANTGRINKQLLSYPPLDTTKPVAALASSPAVADGLDGWFVSPVTLTASATDDFTPGATIKTMLDGNAWANYSAPIAVPEGSHTIQAQATDDSSNVSDIVSWSGKVDTIAPVAVGTSSDDVVTVSATDGGSGLGTVEYVLSDDVATSASTWSTYAGPVTVNDTNRVVSYRATDVAGNVSAIGSVTILAIQEPAVDTPSISLDKTSVVAGESVIVTGQQIADGDYTLVLHSTPATLASVTVVGGTFSASVVIPVGTAPGAHSVVLTAFDGSQTATASLVVTAASEPGAAVPLAADPTSSPTAAAFQLPSTGASSGLLMLALALMLGGAVVLVRRRLMRRA